MSTDRTCLTTHMSKDLKEKIRQRAERERRSVSSFVRGTFEDMFYGPCVPSESIDLGTGKSSTTHA